MGSNVTKNDKTQKLSNQPPLHFHGKFQIDVKGGKQNSSRFELFKILNSGRGNFSWIFVNGVLNAELGQNSLTLDRAGGVNLMPSLRLWGFWNDCRTAWRIVLKFSRANGTSFAQLWNKKDRARLGYEDITPLVAQPPTDSQRNRVFSSLTCCHWLEWGHLGQTMNTDFWYRMLTFQRSSDCTDLDWRHTYHLFLELGIRRS